MKIDPKTMLIAEYTGREFPCACGRSHSTQLKAADIGAGALNRLADHIRGLGCRSPLVVCDRNTAAAAGFRVRELLLAAGMEVRFCLLEREGDLVPDETALGEMLVCSGPAVDVLVAVGTGTINDLCKYMSYQTRLPYIVVATAPSMDGYASTVAALISGNLKITYETQVAKVIVGDLDVLSQAPTQMILAGLADILGKYTCLIDWRLSHLINGEYYCKAIVDMVRESIRRVVDNAQGMVRREPQAIKELMDALSLTGIAMSFVGNSRPASGSEHHLSHFWEMRFLFDNKPAVLHGRKVGVGTVLSSQLYHSLKDFTPDRQKALDFAESFDMATWEREMERCYGKAAPGVIALEKKVHKNAGGEHTARVDAILAHWEEILQMVEADLPTAQAIRELLEGLGASALPAQVGVDGQTVRDSIVAAKELRNRYTVLQMLWDLGLLEQLAAAQG